MDQIVNIAVPTAVVCLGIFFVILFIDFILARIWSITSNVKIRETIKWVWTMWLPLWPIALGAVEGTMKSMPLPDMIAKLGSDPGPVSVTYGAFCGLISMAVVKAIKHALEQKGIDVDIPDLSMARMDASNVRNFIHVPKKISLHSGNKKTLVENETNDIDVSVEVNNTKHGTFTD